MRKLLSFADRNLPDLVRSRPRRRGQGAVQDDDSDDDIVQAIIAQRKTQTEEESEDELEYHRVSLCQLPLHHMYC
jgi:hypothetical protein